MIARRPLREDVRRELLERLVSRALAPGAEVRETALAAELGVSRTPLREALLALERDGFLDSSPGRGFWVRPLTAREAREIYPLVAALEALALRTAELDDPDREAELERLNEAMEEKEEPQRRLKLDTQWHETLVRGCHNKHLLVTLATLRELVWRYELPLMRESNLVGFSVRQHAGIVEALAHGDMEVAVDLLERHWLFGMECVLEGLDDDAR